MNEIERERHDGIREWTMKGTFTRERKNEGERERDRIRTYLFFPPSFLFLPVPLLFLTALLSPLRAIDGGKECLSPTPTSRGVQKRAHQAKKKKKKEKE